MWGVECCVKPGVVAPPVESLFATPFLDCGPPRFGDVKKL